VKSVETVSGKERVALRLSIWELRQNRIERVTCQRNALSRCACGQRQKLMRPEIGGSCRINAARPPHSPTPHAINMASCQCLSDGVSFERRREPEPNCNDTRLSHDPGDLHSYLR